MNSAASNNAFPVIQKLTENINYIKNFDRESQVYQEFDRLNCFECENGLRIASGSKVSFISNIA